MELLTGTVLFSTANCLTVMSVYVCVCVCVCVRVHLHAYVGLTQYSKLEYVNIFI
jgi:hypothetical protein